MDLRRDRDGEEQTNKTKSLPHMCVCVRRQLHSEQATDYSFSTDTSKGTVRHCDDTSRQRVINWYVLKRLFLDEVQQQQNSPKMLPSTRYQRHLFESRWLTPPKKPCEYFWTTLCAQIDWWLLLLLETVIWYPCLRVYIAQIHVDLSPQIFGFCWNRTDDLEIDSSALWQTELVLHRLIWTIRG